MKALVTGGAGFIGSHLAEALVRRGARVTILDDFSRGHRCNLDWIRGGDAVEVVAGDAGDGALVRGLLAGTEVVFHHAALPSVPKSIEQPWHSHVQNLDLTLQLLEAARAGGVRRVVFASSSSIYGDQDAPSKHEGLPPQPLSPYALQKLAAEEYARLYHQLYGLETVSLRYFNVFGPRQDFASSYSGVVARFCSAFVAGERPTVFGDGRQSRDFTYIENVVGANLLAAEVRHPLALGRCFNIAGGTGIDLLQLIEGLQRLTGLRLEPQFEAARTGDVRHSCADIQAAREVLGYTPDVGWEEGLRRTLSWYREQRAGARNPG